MTANLPGAPSEVISKMTWSIWLESEAHVVDDTTKLRRARAHKTIFAMWGPYISIEKVLKWLYFSVVDE